MRADININIIVRGNNTIIVMYLFDYSFYLLMEK